MKKQPAHGCMPADRIICRTWEHTNRALIFQSVPGCPKCPTVPAFRGRDSGTTVENQTSKKVMSNYSLQKYKGTSTRHTCPNCGDRRSFAYYVDESGTPLHPSVGRCNHESGCGYHYTPRQYFHDHPECRTAGDFSSGRQCMAQKPSNRCNRQPSVTYRRTMWRNRRACIATSAVSFQYCLIPITAARQRKCWNG